MENVDSVTGIMDLSSINILHVHVEIEIDVNLMNKDAVICRSISKRNSQVSGLWLGFRIVIF